jgi:hypothetical protein
VVHFGISQDQLVNQKIIPTKASWEETVWKGPIDFISSRAEGDSESQNLQQPQSQRLENDASSSRSDGNPPGVKLHDVGSIDTVQNGQVWFLIFKA